MVWPLYPIVVYGRLTETCISIVVLARIFPGILGISSWWAFVVAPLSVGLYLRFVRFPPDPDDTGDVDIKPSEKSDEQTATSSSKTKPGVLGHPDVDRLTSLDPKPHLMTSASSYQYRKKGIADAAAQLVSDGGKLRMWKATASNTFRHDQIDTRASKEGKLDLSSFHKVIRNESFLDLEKTRVVDVEASTTFESFVDALLPAGHMPLCVPELRTITVGGAVVGIGIESSSFRHGFFHEGMVGGYSAFVMDSSTRGW